MKMIMKTMTVLFVSLGLFTMNALAGVDQSLTGKPELDNEIRGLQKEWASVLAQPAVNRYPDPRAPEVKERLRQVMAVPVRPRDIVTRIGAKPPDAEKED